MATLFDLLTEHTTLPADDVDHVQRLVGEWQLLADLSFADLLMWVPTGPEFLCVAQVRPTTATTTYPDDQVGRTASGVERTGLRTALAEGRIFRESDPDWREDGTALRREAIPIRRAGQPQGPIVALIGRDTDLSFTRSPSNLEIAYLQTAGELCRMIAEGGFPNPDQPVEPHSGPRVGDGLLRLDVDGYATYASPNALSAYRRLGMSTAVIGERLGPATRALVSDPFDGEELEDRIRQALNGRTPLRMEVEARGATVLFRALPLRVEKVSLGALVLVRDMTEIRRRDRQLISKDATIREIHHRVKNNLQTVAALLRLQARRVNSPDAKAALQESVRRVASIALVHETLSTSHDERVPFDEIVDRVLSMVREVAAAESQVVLRRIGSFGELPAEVATPLVMVLTELAQNAVEHGFPPPVEGDGPMYGEGGPSYVARRGPTGTVEVRVTRAGKWLDVVVADDGVGVPEGFDIETGPTLGMQIVQTLVSTELQGTIVVRPREGRGTEAVLRARATKKL